MQKYKFPAQMSRVFVGVIVLPLLISCKAAPMTNVIIAKAYSPNGKLAALLVDRYIETARVSDGFFLIVVPSEENLNRAINNRDIETYSAFVATSARKVQFNWRDNTTLLLVCDACGLSAIDITKKLDHINSVRIVYQGFPEHTAYS